MGSDPRGGIMQGGMSGSFTYTAKADMGNKPVNFVSWFDTLRFANWLNNGQANGDTETGAYTLFGGTPTPSNFNAVTRNAGATWFLPNENEWYKAAYYDPRTAAQGGPPGDDHYWLYATKSDIAPTLASANIAGGISNSGTNVANYNHGADWNGQDGNVTDVGGASSFGASFYGTFDQDGNVWELNEGPLVLSPAGFGYLSQIRGGSWNDDAGSLISSDRTHWAFDPTAELDSVGFRVASVPEPSSLVLAAFGVIGGLALLAWRRRT